jgi:O-antigen/teichoic acid export membrane protein
MNQPSGGRHPSSLRKSSFWLLLARLTAQGLAVLFIALVARLGVDTFGQFTVIATLILIGNTLTNFGTDTLLIREIARSGQISPIAANALGLQMLLSAGWCLVMLVYTPGSPLFIYSLALFPLAIFSVTTAILRAFERMDLFWGLSLINGVAQLLAAWLSSDLWTLCTFMLAAQIATALLSMLICSMSLANFRLLPFSDIRPLLRLTWPFAVLTLLLVLSQRVGVLSVSTLIDDTASGLFSAAARVVEGLKLGHHAVLGAFLPVLARNAPGSKQNFLKGFLVLLGLSFLLASSLIFLAGPIVTILYGSNFTPASSMLSVLSWSLLPYTISAFISYHMAAGGLEHILLKAALIALIATILSYIGFISIFGLPGAAWAALTGEILQAIVFLYFLPRARFTQKQTEDITSTT